MHNNEFDEVCSQDPAKCITGIRIVNLPILRVTRYPGFMMLLFKSLRFHSLRISCVTGQHARIFLS